MAQSRDERYQETITLELAGLDELAAEYSPNSPECRAVRDMQAAIRAALPAMLHEFRFALFVGEVA
jgi:hypothetical protein